MERIHTLGRNTHIRRMGFWGHTRIFGTQANTLLTFSISNIQITYQLIDFGDQVQSMIASMPKFFIKSTGWNNSCVAIPNGTSGSQNIVYNQ